MEEKDELESAWQRHERQEAGTVSLEFQRYTVDGRQACSAWSGAGDHPAMRCFFASRVGFGDLCRYTGRHIDQDLDGFPIPVDGCPLWR